MASSFTLTSGSYQGRYLQLSCTQTQNIAANQSTVSWTLTAAGGESSYYTTGPTAVVINGVQVYYKARTSWDAAAFPAARGSVSGTVIVDHNSDGGKAIAVSLSTAIYTGTVSTYGGTWTLDSIPRKANITSAPDFTDLENPTITYSNPAGNAVTALDACISFTGARADIDYRAISKTGSTYQFPLTDAERDTLRNNTTGPTRKVIFYVRTKIANTVYYSTLEKTLSIEESTATKPEVSMTLSPVSTLGEPFKSMYIQGKSKVKAELTISTKYGAAVAASNITVEGSVYASPYESGILSQAGTQKIKATVKDSRGFYGTNYADIYVVAYSKPKISSSAVCYRSDENGKRDGNSASLWIRANRSYYDVEGKNSCALEWRRKSASEVWDDSAHQWNELLAETDTTTDWYDALIPDVEFDLKKAYTVQIRASDTIGEQDIKTFDIPTQDVALHLGKGGKNVSVGSYCDYDREYTFRSKWDAIFDKSVTVNGGMNGVYIKTAYLTGGAKVLRLQSKFTQWDAEGTSRQSFLIFGSTNGAPVLGVCVVHNQGYIAGQNIDNATAGTEADGVVTVTMKNATYDWIAILSPHEFSVL